MFVLHQKFKLYQVKLIFNSLDEVSTFNVTFVYIWQALAMHAYGYNTTVLLNMK